MKRFIRTFVILPLFVFVCSASAEVAVRHASVSENEFQALAQALGYTPVAEIISQQSVLPNEVFELFRARLFEAQKEWLSRAEAHEPQREIPSAIDHFLELRSNADWAAAERQAFVTFFIRKLSTSAVRDEVFRDLAAFLVNDDSMDLSEMNPALRSAWLEWRSANRKTWVSFPSSLPSDVTAVIVNGQLIPRASALTLAVPRSSIRVTFLSNAMQPISLILKGTEMDWPLLERRAWVHDDCSTAKAPGTLAEMKFKILGFSNCDGVSKQAIPPPTADRAQIEDFGLAKNSKEPFEVPAQSVPTIFAKPMFWGVVGAVVLGVVVASQLRDRSSPAAITPSSSEGW